MKPLQGENKLWLPESVVLPELRRVLVEGAQVLLDAPPEVFQFDRLLKSYLEIVVRVCRGNVSTAARILGWHRRTLQRRLEKTRVNAHDLGLGDTSGGSDR